MIGHGAGERRSALDGVKAIYRRPAFWPVSGSRAARQSHARGAGVRARGEEVGIESNMTSALSRW